MITGLEGKVALITGAAGDIGAAIARHFVYAGARVALVDRDAYRVERTAHTIGSAASWHECDVSDEASMAEAIATAECTHERIDIGILNAGISLKRTPLEDIETATYDRIMEVNSRGVFLGLKHLFPVMKRAGGGSIVITSSTEGLRGNAGIAPYVASKHAVIGLAKTAALEWADHNIRVNCINPGPVDTTMMRAVEQAAIDAGATDVRQRNVERVPMKRFAQADEVAKFAVFLSSEGASYSTGGVYVLDGGVLAGKMAHGPLATM